VTSLDGTQSAAYGSSALSKISRGIKQFMGNATGKLRFYTSKKMKPISWPRAAHLSQKELLGSYFCLRNVKNVGLNIVVLVQNEI
jgi:hypothetical protein